MVSRYTLQQNNIFVTATAREAFLGEADVNISQNVYLERIRTFECPNTAKFRVAIFVNPDPGATENSRLEANIKAKIDSTINTSQEVEVQINPPISFLTADPVNC